jgi:hypothetical protein
MILPNILRFQVSALLKWSIKEVKVSDLSLK